MSQSSSSILSQESSAQAVGAPATILADGVRDLRGDIGRAFAAYADEALGTRLFLRGRHLLCPLRKVAAFVPATGRVLDIGCGHGLFPSLLATGSSQRQIVGVDPAEGKVAIARRSAAAFPNVRYIRGSVLDLNDGPYDAITILDVMYLLPDELATTILKKVRQLIASDGVFLLKTNDTRPLWKYGVVRLEEWLMVKLLRYTYGGELHFRSREQYLNLLDQAGFTAEVKLIDSFRPVPHRLFVCRPKAG